MFPHEPLAHTGGTTRDHNDLGAAAVNLGNLFADCSEANEGGAAIFVGDDGGAGFDEDTAGVAEGGAGFGFFGRWGHCDDVNIVLACIKK